MLESQSCLRYCGSEYSWPESGEKKDLRKYQESLQHHGLSDTVLGRSDAVRAAYDALASAVRGLAKDPIGNTHDALVAAIYRELLPSGSLPVAAHTTLAMLRDLTSLEDHGVELEEQMARQAVEDARKWVDRLEVRS